MRTFAIGWIVEIYLRNAALLLLLLVAGPIHLRLYVLKSQDKRYKFNSHFPRIPAIASSCSGARPGTTCSITSSAGSPSGPRSKR